MLEMIKKGLIGLTAGIISGLFATGGGLILVPAFMYFLKLDGTKARGTSIFCILPMVITSSFFYYKGNYINWNTSLLCSIGGAIGGYFGARILKKLPEKYMKIIFTFFLIYISYKMMFK